ncbi:related to FAD/FMN-containing dehydrogenases [Cephalotrichum gorgonifer]|uniref:Related to FAD/FMN-containing dehydrogenases n=1 Tax=Cephalotrichum gorgonifer TaxID=2041049 RepID=A0AAE8N6B7_9PEZI|nr:related to FAD/FMN-containing dehydrogenases [Cephalotrichum gorgonifer]
MWSLRFMYPAALLATLVSGASLTEEAAELTAEDTSGFGAIKFADAAKPPKVAQCRAFPGSDDWPSDCQWRRLNATLHGRLLNPDPPAAVCYQGDNYDSAKCRDLFLNAGDSHFYIDDPLSVLSQWTQGSTCKPALNAQGNCTRGGFPVYVVNATRVADVQAGVNFARNKNLRLVIKNTGHDFGGRSVGAGSLSIWTHHLKSFEFIPEYKQGEYSGMAVKYGAGLEAWELYNYMAEYNFSVPAAGGRTVGANGGWFASGGHGNLASFYGLGCDQALEIHAVTADGRAVVANSETNSDLFYALRGGGGSTYAVVTSVVMKAYPPINLVVTSLIVSANTGTTSASAYRTNDTEVFWTAMSTYFRFSAVVVDAGGVDWSYLTPMGNDTYNFNVRMTFPNRTAEDVAEILEPLYRDLKAVGIDLDVPEDLKAQPYATHTEAPAAPLADTRYRSRILPRKNWDDDELFAKTFAAIRESIEVGGYTFHGLAIAPTKEVAGWPGKTGAVNPAWRNGVLHSILIGPQPPGLTAEQAVQEEENIQKYMELWREASPGAGAYMNEGDPGEPDWKGAFFGDNYPRLLEIKEKRDPWGVFWAATTVGSDKWEVRTEDGYPRSQNGRLCRVKA